jgi:hypothetical protein
MHTTVLWGMTPPVALAILGAGVLLLLGLLSGVWKYVAIMQSERARAPYYVDITHRAALMYSFAALVLAALAYFSLWSVTVNFWAVAANLVYFFAAITTYAIHGALKDTDNQLRRPHQLGKHQMPSILIQGFMWTLIAAEVGGTLVLLVGAWLRLWPYLTALGAY